MQEGAGPEGMDRAAGDRRARGPDTLRRLRERGRRQVHGVPAAREGRERPPCPRSPAEGKREGDPEYARSD